MQVRECSGCVILSEDAKQVLLVTSSKDRTRYVFPKGGVEAGLTHEQNAIKETAEEAGVAVEILSRLNTTETKRDHHDDNPEPGPYISRDTYFLARFVSWVPWDEFAIRSRAWVSVDEAPALLNGRGGEALQMALSVHALLAPQDA